jgi:hypothetical protein
LAWKGLHRHSWLAGCRALHNIMFVELGWFGASGWEQGPTLLLSLRSQR